MEFIVLYLIFAAIVGVIAGSWGRSGFGWFLVSVLLSPILGLLFLLIAGKASPAARRPSLESEGRVSCEQCYEQIMPQAVVCRFCGAEREPAPAVEEETNAEALGFALGQALRSPSVLAIILTAIGFFAIVSLMS